MNLPVPRLIVVKIAPGGAPDIAQLRRAAEPSRCRAPSLDDHRGWIERMRAMAGTAVAGGIAILLLMIAATMLSVTFATRGAMAANKPVIEVLHFVGAKNGFIAGHFQRHFLLLGLQGGALGGGAAILLFALAGLVSRWFAGTAGGRADGGAVRQLRARHLGLCRDAGADRADRGGHRHDLAPHGQPHAGEHRLACWQDLARWIGFLHHVRRRSVGGGGAGRPASSGSCSHIPHRGGAARRARPTASWC